MGYCPPGSTYERTAHRLIPQRLSGDEQINRRKDFPRRCRRFYVETVDGRHLSAKNAGHLVLRDKLRFARFHLRQFGR